MEQDSLVVGIGVNVSHSPVVPSTGPDCGRPATSITEQLTDQIIDAKYAHLLGNKIFNDICAWLDSSDTSENVLTDVEYCLDKSLQTLRPTRAGGTLTLSDNEDSRGDMRQEIIPLRINPDGSLWVSFFKSCVVQSNFFIFILYKSFKVL